MRFERFPIVLALLFTLSLATAPMFGQSLTTGNITGTVLDPSHAVVPSAQVGLKGLDTGSTASTTTNSSGGYSFSLLKPGSYQITVKQPGFAEVTQTFPATDYAPATGTLIFDIGGNKYRLIARVDFKEQMFFIQTVMTHEKYNRENL